VPVTAPVKRGKGRRGVIGGHRGHPQRDRI